MFSASKACGLLALALTWTAPATAQRPGELEPVQENLFLFRDACNVYVLRNGSQAVLIDLGSGAVLSHLSEIGVTEVAGIYLTHRDRDQWFGYEEAESRRIAIHAPATDPGHMGYTSDSIRRYWKEFFPVPHSRFVYSVVTRETDAAQPDVADGAVLASPVARLQAVAVPGHTNDQVVYLTEMNGRKVAFTGDLIYARGKVWQGFQMDWDHWRATGQEAEFRSLLRIKDENPDLIAPSHGEVLRESIEETLLVTADRIWQTAKLKNFELFAAEQDPPILATQPLRRLETIDIPDALPDRRSLRLERLSEHLWVAANSYFIVADDGASFAVDNDFPPETWDKILLRIGVNKVDFLWVTHLHSDHTRHLPALRQKLGFQLLTMREMADLMEHPAAYLHPYANFDGIRPDRALEDGEEFRWKDYRFRAHFAPGQTWFHSFLETTIDGHRAVFSGDSYYPIKEWDLANGTGGWSGLNRGFPEYHSRSARQMVRIRPDWVLAEHRMPFLFDPLEWRYRVEWGEQAVAILDQLSPSGNHVYDFNPHTFRVYPLISRWSGAPASVELRVDNPFGEPMRVDYRINGRAPAPVDPPEGTFTVPAHSTHSRELRFRIPDPKADTRYVVPVEITDRGRYLGEACYFLVDTTQP